MATKKSRPEALAPAEGLGLADGELAVGFVSGIFGTAGDVRVHLHNRDSDHFGTRRRVVLLSSDNERFAASLKCRSGAGGRVLGNLTFAGGGRLHSREDAASLRDWQVVISKASLPKLNAEEFYLIDLIGRSVAVEGEILGAVTQVHQTGPVDILEITTIAGEVGFVPALAENIADIHADPVVLQPAARDLLL